MRGAARLASTCRRLHAARWLQEAKGDKVHMQILRQHTSRHDAGCDIMTVCRKTVPTQHSSKVQSGTNEHRQPRKLVGDWVAAQGSQARWSSPVYRFCPAPWCRLMPTAPAAATSKAPSRVHRAAAAGAAAASQHTRSRRHVACTCC
jgi:hypothetical protein